MAEIDGRLARIRMQIIRLQEDRRVGRDEFDVVRALIPINAEMLQYIADVMWDRSRRLEADQQ